LELERLNAASYLSFNTSILRYYERCHFYLPLSKISLSQ